MTSQEHKKLHETQILRNFIQAYDDFPKGKIVEGESPDFILKPNKKSAIGIELSELYFPDDFGIDGHSSIEEEVKKRIVERTKELFLNEHNYPLSVHICFADDTPYARLNIDFLSAHLNKVLEAAIKKHKGGGFFQHRLKGSVLPEYFTSINMVHHPDDKLSVWNYNKRKVKQHMFIEVIETIINKKEGKLELYQKNLLDSYWLLIHTEDLKCLMSFNLNNLFDRWSANSKFDSIFIFDYFNGSYFILY